MVEQGAPKPTPEEFWSKVVRTDPSACWPWQGSLHFNGYGSWQRGRSNFVAHRLAYEFAHGQIPPRTHLFHTCELRSCVNPGHLRQVDRPDPRACRDRPVTTVEIAWAAGIWEGEGSCWPTGRTRPRHGRSTTAHASVTQRDPERWVLERFRYLFGGSIHIEKAADPESCFRWRITGARARGFLMTVYALLSPWRRQQVRAALLRSRPRSRRRDVCKRGHALSGANVLRGSYGRRQCKKCVDLNRHAREARRRQAASSIAPHA